MRPLAREPLRGAVPRDLRRTLLRLALGGAGAAAPSPFESAVGSMPRTIAADVIRMGRSRVGPASNSASIMGRRQGQQHVREGLAHPLGLAEVKLSIPCTPEAVLWAIEAAR